MTLKPDNIKLRRLLLRYLALFSGLFIVSNGIVMTIRSDLGVNPWDVLHIGIAGQTGLSIGRVIQAVGFLLVVISYLSRVKLNIGTILNMLFLGFFVDLIIGWNYVPQPIELRWRIFLYISGVVVFGLGIAVYISANLGAGPRDSLMLALTKASPFRVGTVRTFMEIGAAAAGYLLGGPLGIGTFIFALTIGFFMELGFALIRKIRKTTAYGLVWNGASRHARGL